jgi:glycosyltransferase involved in cell wall biosynthesis
MVGQTAMDGPALSVVVPVYNEGSNIEGVLRAFEAAVRTPHEVLVVYDFDEDTTVPVVSSLLADLPAVRLHRNEIGRGVLNALKSGMADARAPLVLVMMADGSDDPTDVDRMVGLASRGADVVAGSRYALGGRQLGGPMLKRAMSRLAGLSLYWLGALPIHDATNNFRLYRRSFLEAVRIESDGGFELAIELTVKAHLAGRSLAEVPTTWRDRTAGASRFRLRAWLPRYLRWYLLAVRYRLRALLPG